MRRRQACCGNGVRDMRKTMTRFLLYVALLLAACGGGGGSGDSPPPPPDTPSGKILQQSTYSRQTAQLYNVTIYLPPGYDQSTQVYPIIYLMDAETRFQPSLTVLQQSGVNAILVGIGNMGSDRRFIDFEMPGAAYYYNFLTLELIPIVESQFRVDATQRVINGQSLSGLMVMYALFLEQPDNRHYFAFISEDGSMFEQPDILSSMEQQMYATSHALPVTLAMSGDSMGNLPNVAPLCSTIGGHGYTGLKLELLSYSLGHVPMDVPAFGDSLNYVFNLGKVNTGIATPC
jgi:hypothetical protein